MRATRSATILQDLDVQLLIRDQSLQPCVLLLEILQSPDRVAVHRTVLRSPAVKCHLGHSQRPCHYGADIP